MTTILCIGVVTALGVFVIVLKTCASEPKKANKSEKAGIMKQLLELAERENSTPEIPPSRSGSPRAVPGKRQRALPRKPTARASQPAASPHGRC